MLGRAVELGAAEFGFAQHRTHLRLEIGVGLRGGPDGKKQMARIDAVHLSTRYPILDHLRLFIDERFQFTAQIGTDLRRAVQHFVGKHARRIGVCGGEPHLGADVIAECHGRICVATDAVRFRQPQRERVVEHRAVKCRLGAEIVMQVRFWQARFFGDFRHGGTRKTGPREYRFGRDQNVGLGRIADVFLAARRGSGRQRLSACRRFDHRRLPVLARCSRAR